MLPRRLISACARSLESSSSSSSSLSFALGRGPLSPPPPPLLWARRRPSPAAALCTAVQPLLDNAAPADAASEEAPVASLPCPLPRQIFHELDRHIVGQAEAKRAVAVALRNRWRVQQMPSKLQGEIIPKNILMIGPTGVGKTEIARRIAKMTSAPFLKVEATKFTELGYVGSDVDTIIHDLVEVGLRQVKECLAGLQEPRQMTPLARENLIRQIAEQRPSAAPEAVQEGLSRGDFDALLIDFESFRLALLQDLATLVQADPSFWTIVKAPSPFIVADACKIFYVLEEKSIHCSGDKELLTRFARALVERNGIVFIDEIDKICAAANNHRSGVSTEGVQRDLLPIIEGTTVITKHGDVDTSKILFICSGAFHMCKPSDMMAELQGRLPIKVELKGLTEPDFFRILTEPQYNLIRQNIALLNAEGVPIEFSEETIREIAKIAFEINTVVQNIGARRLHTVLEKLLEEISFSCGKRVDVNDEGVENNDRQGDKIVITSRLVRKRVGDLLKQADLTKFIL